MGEILPLGETSQYLRESMVLSEQYANAVMVGGK